MKTTALSKNEEFDQKQMQTRISSMRQRCEDVIKNRDGNSQ